MPQKDHYRDRTLELDFKTNESFRAFPYPARFSLTLVTDGSTTGILNDKTIMITAPCIFCLSDKDSIRVNNCAQIVAQTLSFSTDFFGVSNRKEDENVPTGLSIFQRSDINTGLFVLEKAVYGRIWEWLFIIGTEVFAQSDPLWVCRIKKYLLQIMGMLIDLYREQEHNPMDLALSHIYANYFRKITLDELCRQAHVNRVSLNKMFRERFGCTAMEYLNNYRLKMAERILTYTRMNLNEVAHATGFEYDT